jgi:bifunctional non-homologous end joining protein LigD
MLAKAVDQVPEGGNWTMEKKEDGWRCLAEKQNGQVNLFTRTGKRITALYYIEQELQELPDGTILDGEIVNLSGGDEWNKAQEICSRDRPHNLLNEGPPLTYVVFDILQVAGKSLMEYPLYQRREALSFWLDTLDIENVIEADHMPASQIGFQHFIDNGAEGVVCKKRDGKYRPGNRGIWVKVKGIKELDVLCTGFYEPEEGSKHSGVRVGGLLFEYDHNGKTVKGKCAGKVDDKLRGEWYDKPEDYIGKMFEVEHYGINKTGALRMPQFRRFRDEADKAAPAAKKISASPERTVTKMRNYKAMKYEKLVRTRDELYYNYGEAVDKAMDVYTELQIVEGLIVQHEQNV